MVGKGSLKFSGSVKARAEVARKFSLGRANQRAGLRSFADEKFSKRNYLLGKELVDKRKACVKAGLISPSHLEALERGLLKELPAIMRGKKESVALEDLVEESSIYNRICDVFWANANTPAKQKVVKGLLNDYTKALLARSLDLLKIK